MKPRRLVTAGELAELYAHIERELAIAGLRSRPEVVAKLLSLVTDQSAGLREYAKAVSSDPVLSGRLLKIANSAYFAQRSPVTSLDRACVLLGVERLKALTLGFYASRAAVDDPHEPLARQVWTRSVYRACLAAGLARRLVAPRAAEAFVVGLLVEAGVPLMARTLDWKFLDVLERHPDPVARFEAEFAQLPFTSVDVVAALARSWKFPPLLVRPLEWQRQEPTAGDDEDETRILHRIAHAVSALRVASGPKDGDAVRHESTLRVPGLTDTELDAIILESGREYKATIDVFRDVADELRQLDALLESVQEQLNGALEATVIASLQQLGEVSGEFQIGGRRVRASHRGGDMITVMLIGSDGKPVLSEDLPLSRASLRNLLECLSLETQAEDQSSELEAFLRRLLSRAA